MVRSSFDKDADPGQLLDHRVGDILLAVDSLNMIKDQLVSLNSVKAQIEYLNSISSQFPAIIAAANQLGQVTAYVNTEDQKVRDALAQAVSTERVARTAADLNQTNAISTLQSVVTVINATLLAYDNTLAQITTKNTQQDTSLSGLTTGLGQANATNTQQGTAITALTGRVTTLEGAADDVGAKTFLELTDTPESYAGAAGKMLVVGPDGTIVYQDVPTGGGGGGTGEPMTGLEIVDAINAVFGNTTWQAGDGSNVITHFDGLFDTPLSKGGSDGKFLKVEGDFIVYADLPSGGGGGDSLTGAEIVDAIDIELGQEDWKLGGGTGGGSGDGETAHSFLSSGKLTPPTLAYFPTEISVNGGAAVMSIDGSGNLQFTATAGEFTENKRNLRLFPITSGTEDFEYVIKLTTDFVRANENYGLTLYNSVDGKYMTFGRASDNSAGIVFLKAIIWGANGSFTSGPKLTQEGRQDQYLKVQRIKGSIVFSSSPDGIVWRVYSFDQGSLGNPTHLGISVNTGGTIKVEHFEYKQGVTVIGGVGSVAAVAATKYVVSTFTGDAMVADEMIQRHRPSENIRIVGVTGNTPVAPTGVKQFSIAKNGVPFGILTFDGNVDAVYTTSGVTEILKSDVLSITAPAVADPLLINLTISIEGEIL